ncbi:uncharacterized protein LOC101849135 isoform X2 [Aplysia californica]|uniref:Uncharacterized protein LOC101849135 isoform X2 n=1 Tax=Aplysia californica TaxID=6500 RepID=A0ABM0JTU7_APLCA|nr:uncharacterized protein LOC101849135 isoform X2 [Aplysia californica]
MNAGRGNRNNINQIDLVVPQFVPNDFADDSPTERDPGPGYDGGYIAAGWRMIKSLVVELFPFLHSRLNRTQQCILENPCTSVFYSFIAVFGVFPMLFFLLTICSVFTLSVVGFVCCQVVMFCLAATVFTGVMFFIVSTSFLIACSCGATIHTFYLWRWMKNYMLQHGKEILIEILDNAGAPGLWLKNYLFNEEPRDD